MIFALIGLLCIVFTPLAKAMLKKQGKNTKQCRILLLAGVAFLVVGFAVPEEPKEPEETKVTIEEYVTHLKEIPDFEYCEVTYDDEKIEMRATVSGVTAEVMLAKENGYGSGYAPWAKMREECKAASESVFADMASNGFSDRDFYLILLNDENKENALLIVKNGLVKYDVME